MVFEGLYLDQLRVELDRLGSIGDGIAVCFSLDICLEDKIQPVSHAVPESEPRRVVTHLGSVGVEGGLGSVCLDGLVIEADRSGPISSSKRLVALVLEVDG